MNDLERHCVLTEFGEQLRACRKKRGWSQDVLAAKLGVKRNSITTYENGSVCLTLPRLAQLTRIFEISLDEAICNGFDKAARFKRLKT